MQLSADRTCNILVVDDSEDDRLLVQRLLKSSLYACTFTEAETLEEAKQHLADASFDCVLIDYQLPGYTGLDVVNQLLDRPSRRFMGTIMITGEGSEALAVDALKAGVDDYLIKGDLNPSSIDRALRNSLAAAKARKHAREHRQALENFSGLVAHDLLSPLSTMLGFLELTVEEHGERLPKAVTENLEHATSSGRYMSKMIKGLLTYAKSGRNDSAPELSDLTELAHEGLSMCSTTLTNANAAVDIDALPEARVNVNEFIQLFQNLILNAVKHTDSEAPHVRIYLKSKQDTITVAVEDNGPGIDAAAIEKIFEPLQRATSKKEGLGLGLALCNKIVTAADGNLWCESEPGSGATFYIELPKP